jgi:hypothetical protein
VSVGLEKQRAASRRWAVEHPERMHAYARKYHLRKKFGITPEEYDGMLETQGGSCAICGTTDPKPNKCFSVDHDHETGEVRGLLCLSCNTSMGLVGDDPDLLRKAIAYLERAA